MAYALCIQEKEKTNYLDDNALAQMNFWKLNYQQEQIGIFRVFQRYSKLSSMLEVNTRNLLISTRLSLPEAISSFIAYV